MKSFPPPPPVLLNKEPEVDPKGSPAAEELVAEDEELVDDDVPVDLLNRDVAAWNAELPTLDCPIVDWTAPPVAELDELEVEELLEPRALDCTTLFMFWPLENSLASRWKSPRPRSWGVTSAMYRSAPVVPVSRTVRFRVPARTLAVRTVATL